MKSSRGFTLIEMMMVVTILAVLVTIAIPSFSELRDRNTVDTDSNKLLSSILLARSEAVKREIPVQFSVNAGATTWQVAAEQPPGSNQFVNVLLQHVREPSSATTITPLGNAGTITFNPRGRSAVMGGGDFFTVTITRASYTYRNCILFSPIGRPTIVRKIDDPIACP
jgi:type IV fimbrial biogenesis protein FimT